MSTIFNVIVYYLFVSVRYNKQILNVVSQSGSITSLFNFTGSIVLIFAAIFIGYSNSFFVKKRTKEFALYALMGMKKRRIALMLFIENIIIAGISLVIGIAVGTIFSKLFIMGLLRMMNHIIYVEFTFSIEAAKDTGILFLMIFVIASINSYRLIKKVQIVALFSAAKKKEEVRLTRPIFAVISVLMVIFGYWLSQHMINNALVVNMFIVLGLVISGTYGVFFYFLDFFMKQLKKRRKSYYRGHNILTISNIAYRIRNHAYTLATIAILSAMTIVALGMAVSMFYNFHAEAKESYPFTYVYGHKGRELDQEAIKLVLQDTDVELVGSLVMTRAEVQARYIGKKESKFEFRYDLRNNHNYHMLPVSKYNESLGLRQLEKEQVGLEKDESVLIYANFGIDTYAYVKGQDYEINLGDQYKKKVRIIDNKSMNLIYNGYNSKYLIVHDEVYAEYVKLGAPVNSYTCIKTTDEVNTERLTCEMFRLIPKEANLRAYYNDYRTSNYSSAVLAFTAFFVAIVFLLSTGSIIYFKLITEANDEKERYIILRKIGISIHDITWSIRKQMLMMFVMPLFIGLMHSAFALSAFGTLLGAQILVPVIATMVGYSVIYLVYYILTVNYYRKVVLC